MLRSHSPVHRCLGAGLLAGALAFVAAEPLAAACGGFFSARTLTPEQRPSLTREKVLIVHDAARGRQHFIREVAFRRADHSFGFVVPTPTRPEVAKVERTPFTRLRDRFPFTEASDGYGSGAGALELVAAGPGHPFDAELAEKLTPKVVVHGVPEVAQRAHTLDGPLDKDIVRRIIRAHINEVRYCYNQGLEQDDRLAGRVTIDFEVLPSGRVSAAAVGASTLPDPAVNTCIAAAVRRWKFPAAAAVTKVSYPFELSPAR